MAAGYMANLVSHNADQFALVIHGFQETRVDKDKAVRGGKGVELLVFNHKKVIYKILGAGDL